LEFLKVKLMLQETFLRKYGNGNSYKIGKPQKIQLISGT
jgi:hypothetical protein